MFEKWRDSSVDSILLWNSCVENPRNLTLPPKRNIRADVLLRLAEIELDGCGWGTERDTETQEKCHCCQNKCILYHQYKHLYKKIVS